MNVKRAMILAAGLGTRMKPLTLETPKPLIKVGSKNLLERSINLLENHGVEQIIINVHYLATQVEKFISNVKSKVKITISDEKDLLLGHDPYSFSKSCADLIGQNIEHRIPFK